MSDAYDPLENEATVLQLPDALNISLADILYILQGTGRDRDKKMSLEQLRDFLAVSFSKISFGNGVPKTEISAGNLKLQGFGKSFSFDDSLKISFGSSTSVSVSNDAIALSYGSYNVVVNSSGVTISGGDGQNITIDNEGISVNGLKLNCGELEASQIYASIRAIVNILQVNGKADFHRDVDVQGNVSVAGNVNGGIVHGKHVKSDSCFNFKVIDIDNSGAYANQEALNTIINSKISNPISGDVVMTKNNSNSSVSYHGISVPPGYIIAVLFDGINWVGIF